MVQMPMKPQRVLKNANISNIISAIDLADGAKKAVEVAKGAN